MSSSTDMSEDYDFMVEHSNWNDTNYTYAEYVDYAYYDYSSVDAVYKISMKDAVVAFSYALIFLLGMIGNTLVIFCVAKYKRMQSITNQLLLSLACADLMLTLVCVPVKFAELFSFGWTFGAFLCKFTHYIQTMTMITSVMTLTAISMERYYAIAKPLRAKYICTTNHARGVILAIWTLASIFATPTLFAQKHYLIGRHNTIYWCNRLWHMSDPTLMDIGYHTALAVAYDIYMLFLLFIVPVVIMTFAYCGVCVELWMVTKPSAVSASPSHKALCEGNAFVFDESSSNLPRAKFSAQSFNDSREMAGFSKSHHKENQIRQRVLNMLITVVAIFIICWAPLLSYNLVVSTGLVEPYLPYEFPYAKILDKTFSLMAFMNSSINPLIYGFMSRYFRKSFRQALTACCLLGGTNYTYYNSPVNDNRTSSLRRNVDKNASSKRTTLSTGAESGSLQRNTADSTLSRSPPHSPL